MRGPLFVPVIVLAMSLPAAAVKLETAAVVELVAPAAAQLDHWNASDAPAWSVTGAPDEWVQLSLELRTAAGRRLPLDGGEVLRLDQDGQARTTLPLPAAIVHDPVEVVTLVVCRE